MLRHLIVTRVKNALLIDLQNLLLMLFSQVSDASARQTMSDPIDDRYVRPYLCV